MAKRDCSICGEERQVGWPGAKLCSHCNAWVCSKCGSGLYKCPHCHKLY